MNTSKSVTNCFSIINGPSKSVLFDSCQYAYSKDVKVYINFAIPQGYSNHSNDATKLYLPMQITDTVITGIQHEDGSGESFNLEGHCKVDIDYHIRNDGVCRYQYRRFTAYYNSKSRKGTITLIANFN